MAAKRSASAREDRGMYVPIEQYITSMLAEDRAINERGVKVPDMRTLKIYANPGVLRCLGFRAAPDGDINAALGKGGALRKTAGVFAALTNRGLPPSYTQSVIDDDTELDVFNPEEDSPVNLAIAQYDGQDGSGGLRGFALLQVKNGDGTIVRAADQECSKESATMELLVLGNAAARVYSKMGPRSQRSTPRGGNIIRCVQFLGRELRRGIFLFGLETVVPLYEYFGWRITTSAREATESICPIPEHMLLRSGKAPSNIGAFMKKYGSDRDTHNAKQLAARQQDFPGTTAEEIDDEYDARLTRLLGAIQGKKHYAEMLKGADVGHATESKAEAVAEAREAARDQGYAMLLCPQLNVYSEQYGDAGDGKKAAAKQGGRRKRKRTRKRALRKRHRRTRHKKKRRKTHKRKRRRRTRKRRR